MGLAVSVRDSSSQYQFNKLKRKIGITIFAVVIDAIRLSTFYLKFSDEGG